MNVCFSALVKSLGKTCFVFILGRYDLSLGLQRLVNRAGSPPKQHHWLIYMLSVSAWSNEKCVPTSRHAQQNTRTIGLLLSGKPNSIPAHPIKNVQLVSPNTHQNMLKIVLLENVKEKNLEHIEPKQLSSTIQTDTDGQVKRQKCTLTRLSNLSIVHLHTRQHLMTFRLPWCIFLTCDYKLQAFILGYPSRTVNGTTKSKKLAN